MNPKTSLKLNSDFRRVYTRGKSAASPRVVLYCRRNRQSENRVGFTVSKKLGNAVTRNRVRRRLREIVRLNAGQMKQNLIVVLNDNQMSIDHNTGALSRYLSRMTASIKYQSVRNIIDKIVSHIPLVNRLLEKIIFRFKRAIKGLFFTDSENAAIDALRTNIARMDDEYKRAVAMTALIRTCAKKRPRGLFTYVGERYNDGRRDLRIPIEDLFVECVKSVNAAVFDNGRKNSSVWGDALSLGDVGADLVYMDPPYYTPKSDNEYVRRYHFLEGLARAWNGVEIQHETKTKKFKSYPTPFSTKCGAEGAFDELFARYRDSVLIVSYSSNSLPSKEQMMSLMSRYKQNVEVLPIDYRYNFGNRAGCELARQKVREFLFIGY